MPKIPDMRSAPWVRFRRDALLPLSSEPEEVQQLKRLTLTLALIFNDLKGLDWATYQLRKDQVSEPVEPTEYNCQLLATRTMFSRYTAGVLAELGHVIDHNRSLVESTTFRDATSQAPAAAKKVWEIIVAFHDRDESQPRTRGRAAPLRESLTTYIRAIRNHAAFHY